MDSDLGAIPGEAAQALLQRMRRKLVDKGEHSPASIEGVQEWLDARDLRLDAEEPDWPADPSEKLLSLRLGEGDSQRVPIINEGGLIMAFCLLAFIEHLFDVAGDMAEAGFVGMCDFYFKVVWQGYAVGILGAQVYRRDTADWTKLFVPLVAVLAPSESYQPYALMFELATLLLRKIARRRGITLAEKVSMVCNRRNHKNAMNVLINATTHLAPVLPICEVLH